MTQRKVSITKYNPIYRDKEGHYQRADWTAISDIGKEFDGKILSYDQYLEVETKYVKAVKEILLFFNTQTVKIAHLYKFDNEDSFRKGRSQDLYPYYLEFVSGQVISSSLKLEALLKLRLRELIGELELIIESKCHAEILFGYDYYMYLVTDVDITNLIGKIEDLGLYIL